MKCELVFRFVFFSGSLFTCAHGDERERNRIELYLQIGHRRKEENSFGRKRIWTKDQSEIWWKDKHDQPTMTYKESTRAREMDHRISFWTYKRWVKFSRFDRKQKMPKWRPSNTTRKCRFFSLISFLSISSTFNWCDMSKRLMRHSSSVHQWQVKLFRKVKRKKVQFDRQQKTKTLAALHQTKRWIYWWKKKATTTSKRKENEKKFRLV